MDRNIKNKVDLSNENIFSKIFKVLKKYGVEEDLTAAAFGENPSFIIITVFDLITDYVDKKISEDKFCQELQKNMNISEKISKDAIKDIKEKVLPYIDKTDDESLNLATPHKSVIKKEVGKTESSENTITELDKYRESID